ncbi:unnamed protein product, partial [Linum tenue]
FIKADKLGLADRLKTPPSPLLPSCTAKPESLPGNNNNTPTKLNLCSLLLLAGWLVLLGLGEFAPFLSLSFFYSLFSVFGSAKHAFLFLDSTRLVLRGETKGVNSKATESRCGVQVPACTRHVSS